MKVGLFGMVSLWILDKSLIHGGWVVFTGILAAGEQQ